MTDYVSLPLKYRPRTWDDVVGQKHAVAVLKASLLQDRIFPTYIFDGTRGSGKTTSARIYAMALNCETDGRPDPCLTCSSCTSALKFQNTDIYEIDGPSYGNVEHIRELREKASFSPTFKRTVFIIDEAHSLSASAFQALLKLLEEPPKHVAFILATTNPERIPATIHSRAIKLTFRRHTEKDVTDRLLHVANLEEIALTDAAATLIARYADGALRDSLTVLDQLHTSQTGGITEAMVSDVLGIVSGTELHTIMTAVLEHDPANLETAVMSTLERTTEFGLIVRALSDWYVDVLRTRAGAEHVVRRTDTDVALLERFAKKLSYDHIDRAITITWDLADKVRYSSSNPKAFFLTGLYRLMLLAEAEAVTTKDAGPPEPVHREVPVSQPEPEPSQVQFTHTTKPVTDLEAELAKLAEQR